MKNDLCKKNLIHFQDELSHLFRFPKGTFKIKSFELQII